MKKTKLEELIDSITEAVETKDQTRLINLKITVNLAHELPIEDRSSINRLIECIDEAVEY